MRRQAEEAQKALDISKPNLTGPMAEWYKKWVASGWVSEDGKLKIPTDPGEIEGAEYMRTAPGGLRVNVRAARGHVRVRLYVGTPATAELLQAPRVTPPVAEAGDLVLYTDGSGGAPGGSGIKRAGWGFAVITGGNGEDDEAATLLASAYGPVVTDEAAPVYMGAHAHTNNTAELSGLGEALYWLLEVDAQPTRAVLLRPDSQYAVGVATGNFEAHANTALAAHVRDLYSRVQRQRGGRVGWSHVRGHKGHKWNDYIDALADRGAASDLCLARGMGPRWALVNLHEPLVDRELTAHEARLTVTVSRQDDAVMVSTVLTPHANTPAVRVAPGESPADAWAIPSH